MGASLAVVAGPERRGLDGKRKEESETTVSCAEGTPRGQERVYQHGLSLTNRVQRAVPRSQVSTFTQARSPVCQLFLTPWRRSLKQVLC